MIGTQELSRLAHAKRFTDDYKCPQGNQRREAVYLMVQETTPISLCGNAFTFGTAHKHVAVVCTIRFRFYLWCLKVTETVP